MPEATSAYALPPNATGPPSLAPGLSTLSDMLASAGDARDLSQQQIPVLRALFEDRDVGLYLFCQHIFQFDLLQPDLHLPLCRFLGHWGECTLADGSTITRPPIEGDNVVNNNRRLMVRIPRDCLKTSVGTRANSLWLLARDPGHDETIGIFNENQDKVEEWIASICQVVEASRLFQVLWREMLPQGVSFWDKEAGRTMPRRWKWGGTGVLFTRNRIGIPELSITPHGIGGAVAGKHYTRKILDDIISKSAANSPAVMQDAVNWVDVSRALERPAENGCELVNFTPWAYADVYSHMLKKWPNDYKVYHRSILEDEFGEPDATNGKSIFPQKMSTNQARKLIETDTFWGYSQYMCIPKAGRNIDFNPEWLHYGSIVYAGTEPCFKIDPAHYDPDRHDIDVAGPAPQLVPLSWMDKAVLLDPAPSKDSERRSKPHSNNGMVVVGIDPWKRRFCFESYAFRDDPIVVMNKLMEFYLKWQADRIGIEEVNFSAVYAPFMLNIIRRDYKLEPTFIPLETKGRRPELRISNNLKTPFADGFWYLNRPECKSLVTEVLEYPNALSDDLIDALAYTDEAVFPTSTPSDRSRNHYRQRREAASLGVTGYGDFV